MLARSRQKSTRSTSSVSDVFPSFRSQNGAHHTVAPIASVLAMLTTCHSPLFLPLVMLVYKLVCVIFLLSLATEAWTLTTVAHQRQAMTLRQHIMPTKRGKSPIHHETFTSPITQVYIEDTDAYGMKYNANYLRSYERALNGAQVGSDSILSKHPDWALTKVTNQKFKSTTALGGNFVIEGTLVKRSDDSEVWDLIMKCPESKTVYNSATVTVGLPLSYSDVEPVVVDDTQDDIATSHHDTLHRDEFDPHHPNHLPLRSVLNLCERSRSNYIGGPDALSRMKEEDDTIVVVTSIDDLCSFQQHSYPRQRVRVDTKFVPKRKGLLCEARHYLFDDETDEPIAQAFVTMVALNATTKRPTEWPLW